MGRCLPIQSNKRCNQNDKFDAISFPNWLYYNLRELEIEEPSEISKSITKSRFMIWFCFMENGKN